jgi:hypothetical protein
VKEKQDAPEARDHDALDLSLRERADAWPFGKWMLVATSDVHLNGAPLNVWDLQGQNLVNRLNRSRDPIHDNVQHA